ncbi:MAG: hypothetical protein R3B07_28685 [Polyangiaceae bacterium]
MRRAVSLRGLPVGSRFREAALVLCLAALTGAAHAQGSVKDPAKTAAPPPKKKQSVAPAQVPLRSPPPQRDTQRALLIDRAVVRFIAAETGGVENPQFIFERELAFEARLEALSDRGFRARAKLPYRERHLRAALERHISETLLAALRIDRQPSERELRVRAQQSRKAWVQRVGGEVQLADAAAAEGLGASELLRVFRRQARASLYIDRMITPMLRPSRAELETLHRSAETPFRGQPFNQVEPLLRNWYISRRLSLALQNFFQNVRARVHISLL